MALESASVRRLASLWPAVVTWSVVVVVAAVVAADGQDEVAMLLKIEIIQLKRTSVPQ